MLDSKNGLKVSLKMCSTILKETKMGIFSKKLLETLKTKVLGVEPVKKRALKPVQKRGPQDTLTSNYTRISLVTNLIDREAEEMPPKTKRSSSLRAFNEFGT